MAVETIIPPASTPLEKSRRERRRLRRPRFSWPAWLARVVLESFFIMLSILLALAVDNWTERRSHLQLAQQSLHIFERELRQNLAAVEDVAPYHAGLRSVVAEAIENPTQAADMRSIVEGLKPVRLRRTAWETALASGALTHIDVEKISRLSLTYDLQEGFRQLTLAAAQRFPIGFENDTGARDRNVRDIYSYLSELVAAEEELIGIYEQAIEMIGSDLREPIRSDSPVTTSP